MLISFWWVVVAFFLGGTGGVLALAIFAGMPEREGRETPNFPGVSHTQ